MKVIAYRKIWFSISGALVVLSIFSIVFFGLNLGIDFTGGSLVELEFIDSATPQISDMRTALDELGFSGQVQPTGESGVLIRTRNLSEPEHQSIISAFSEKFSNVEEMRFDSIGPVIGKELQKTASYGIILVLVLIGLYIAWAFRKVSDPIASWKFGLLTIVAAFHDVLISVGAFSVLGHFFGWEVGSAFVAAALTILGYSINDTVVVFDRTRENLAQRISNTFEETIETSVRQTMARSVYTSITTLLALVAIFAFGGDTTRPFALALIIGIAVGTYSSIFLASPLLVVWEQLKNRKHS
ncbi:MAG: protein translocase subunit SecF [Patescibacteria group bacterium]